MVDSAVCDHGSYSFLGQMTDKTRLMTCRATLSTTLFYNLSEHLTGYRGRMLGSVGISGERIGFGRLVVVIHIGTAAVGRGGYTTGGRAGIWRLLV